jgi:cob(I)alamin adenosyltransferase
VRVYTRRGDDGSTGLAGGQRVSKVAPRVLAYGDVDELNSALGVLLAEDLPDEAAGVIGRVQALLFEIGAFLADPAGRYEVSEQVRDVKWLENWIDTMEADLPPLRTFIVPGGTRSASLAHLARAVARRAERQVVALRDGGEAVDDVLPLLNRLSDSLFVCARWLNRRENRSDVPWQGSR